jgi:hypothetical protein
MSLSALDTLFVATNFEVNEHHDANSKLELCRYEFYEILVRIAKERYKDQGICSNVSDSLDCLINEYVLRFSEPGPWQDFRDFTLWTLEVNDLYEANLNNLRKIHNKMTLKQAIKLMTRKVKTGLSSYKITYCFGMSKMTIMDEMRKPRSHSLQLVEFLEFIGR